VTPDAILAHPPRVLCQAQRAAFTWMPAPTPTSHTGEIVRGQPATMAHLDPTPCPVPPDWSREGYGSVFTVQHTDKAA
jgi:hypothetical protein